MILKKYFLPVVCPSSLFAIVQQALFVVIPLYVIDLGGSLATSAAIIGIKGVGMMMADIPAGMLLARISDRLLMMGSVWLSIVALILMAIFPFLWVVLVASFIQGLSHGAWLVGRISFVTEATEPWERGRVMSLTAGTIRLGNMIGPAVAGLLISLAGYAVTLFVCVFVFLLVLLALRYWTKPSPVRPHDSHSLAGLMHSLKENQHSFKTAGLGAIALMLVRASRALLIPLLGASLLIDPAHIGLAVSIGAFVDTLLFYPAGSMMDRIGRKPLFVATLLIIGAVIFGMSWAEGLTGLIIVSALLGIGNGISAGVIMTIGSDLAPEVNRGSFLGMWRLLSDIGVTSGPFILSSVVKLSGLAVASQVIGLIGIAGGFYVLFTVKETLKKEVE